MLGLPASVTACLFDLDAVLTQTAKVHAAAWKATFDDDDPPHGADIVICDLAELLDSP